MKTTRTSKKDARKKILKRRREILTLLGGDLTDMVKKTPEMKLSLGNDPGDESTLNTDIDLSSAIAERYTDMLKEVDTSLTKMEEGTYGFCDDCGEEIDRRRLDVLPSAQYCVQCQRAREMKRPLLQAGGV